MSVYFIRVVGESAVKIGYAIDVPSRLSAIQMCNYQKLEMIRVIEGGKLSEKWLHKKFSSLRIRGEWFSFSPRMLSVSLPVKIQQTEKILGIKSKIKMKRLSILLPADTMEWLKEKASNNSTNVAWLVRDMLARAMKAQS